MESIVIDSGLINVALSEKKHQDLRNNSKRWYERNKEYAKKISREWRKKNPEKYKLIHKSSNERNRLYINEKAKRWRKDNPDRIKKIIEKHMKKYPKVNGERQIRYRTKLRIRVLSYLNEGQLKCVRCGLEEIKLLQVNHIHSFFSKGIKRTKRDGGSPLWRSVLQMPQEKARAEYEILCSVCNFAAFYEEKYKTKWNIKHIGNRE